MQDVGGAAPSTPAVQGLDGDGLARAALAVACRDDDAALAVAEPAPLLLVPVGVGHASACRPWAYTLRPPSVDHRGDGSGSPGADRRPGAALFLDHVAERRDPHVV